MGGVRTILIVGNVVAALMALLFWLTLGVLGVVFAVVFALAVSHLVIRELSKGFAALDLHDGPIIEEIDSLGNCWFVPAKVVGGVVYHPETNSPICEFDRERFVVSVVKNPHPVSDRASDFIFKIAGKPLIIIDGVVKLPLNKKALSRVESMILLYVQTVSKLSRYMLEKTASLEAVVANSMVKGLGIRQFINRYGLWIVIIVLTFAALMYGLQMLAGVVQAPQMPQMPIIIQR